VPAQDRSPVAQEALGTAGLTRCILAFVCSVARCLLLRAGLVGLVWSSSAAAQVDARALVRALTQPVSLSRVSHTDASVRPRAAIPPAFSVSDSGRLSVLAELPSGVDAGRYGLREVAPGFGALDAHPAEIELLPSELRLTWSPPRRLLLDRASVWTRSAVFRDLTQSGGQGAVIGIVDTGVEVAHPDLRHPDGRTRVAWLIDLTRDPAGRHTDLEEEYGCTRGADFKCAIFDGNDLDELLGNSTLLDEPRDSAGHGTHVASLAAGNGLGSESGRYVGVAPEATLVVARVTRGSGSSVQDADALLGTRFVFERASEMGLPAVVNLSLGTDFGAHDGSSALERALASFVGPELPGRAIVVAVGNSATLHVGQTERYPEPLGVHTEVHVPRGSSVRVPLLTPPTGRPVTTATLYVWIRARSDDALAVGVDDADGRWIAPVCPGRAETHHDQDLEATVLNGTGEEDGSVVQPGNAVVVIDGKWKSGASFAIRLEGRGTARLWVQSEGELSPAAVDMGAVFARAMQQGTVNVPASHPDLIAVGATLNRTDWTDRDGHRVVVEQYGGLAEPQPDSACYFSAAGPTATGAMKPDLVAPGAFVAGAMASLADPATNDRSSIFAGGEVCGSLGHCRVVDDAHAISSGTSMASPLVAGAAALLLCRDPTLTQPQVRALLQAGARRLAGTGGVEQQVGPGALDLERTLEVQLIAESATAHSEPALDPSPTQSWMALAHDYAHPDPHWRLRGILQLRTASGNVAYGFEPSRLRLEVSPGTLAEPLRQQAPGSWTFAVAAPPASGGSSMRLRAVYDEQTLVVRDVPVAVDRWVMQEGVSARGGCTMGRSDTPDQGDLLMMVWALAAVLWQSRRARSAPDRRCRSAARTASHPDQTGATGRFRPS
jgi:subtilisin family serine protease